jgi:uncharacterized membrane protein YheB (UPF0754 family)
MEAFLTKLDPIIGILPWILPPLLGSIIGYVTNAIAISMIFRPYFEKRVLGFRIPFTPGIIPRQRYEFAESIGRMVSRELLTEEAVRAQTASPRFRAGIRGTIEKAVDSVLDTPYSEIKDMISRTGNRVSEDRRLSTVLLSIGRQIPHSDGFRQFIGELIRRGVEQLSQLRLDEVFPERGKRLIDSIAEAVTSERTMSAVQRAAENWVIRMKEEDMCVGDVIGEETISRIVTILDHLYPAIRELLLKWLRSKETRKELEIRGIYLLRDIIDRLNGIQRFLISATQYDRTLETNMSDIVDDAIHWADDASGDPENRRRLIEWVTREIEVFRKNSLIELEFRVGGSIEEWVRTLVEILFGGLRRIVENPVFHSRLVDGFPLITRMTVGEVISGITGMEPPELSVFLSDLILNKRETSTMPRAPQSDIGEGDAKREESAIIRIVGRALKETMEKMFERENVTLGRLTNIDIHTRGAVCDSLTESAVKMVDKKVPEILQSVDVHVLVVEKINSLDIASVEGLLLRVIQKHLRWINIFGAILGAIIGGIQILLNLLHIV